VASVETTGPTVDDAIDAALEKLDLDEDQVDLEILSEGGDDQPARVRATPRSEVSVQPGTEAEGGEAAAEVEWDEGLATAGREIVEDLLDYMGFPGDVDILGAGKENGTPTLTMAIVDGDSMGALIGRRGETLQAFQFITQLLVNRRLGHWTRVLLDIEGIAPCLPGAQLQEVEGDEYRGIVKVKVGPVTAQYKGTATISEKDDATYRAVLNASGRDTRGQGNASASITSPASRRIARRRARSIFFFLGAVSDIGRL